MDPQPINNELPWDLILAALQNTLSPAEEEELRQWLALSPDNRQTYERLQQVWGEGLSDYNAYRAADEGRAWSALQLALGGAEQSRRTEPNEQGERNGRTGQIDQDDQSGWVGQDERPGQVGQNERIGEPRKSSLFFLRWSAVAAVLLLIIGSAWWFFSGKGSAKDYDTVRNEQKTVALPDGTTISIGPQTHLRIGGDYNKKERTVALSAGEARFEVAHDGKLPFVVDMDAATVRDIGTKFIVFRTKDSITVTVTEGKVAFLSRETGESRILAAGGTLVYSVREHRFESTDSVGRAGGDKGSLQFDNAPLSEIIVALSKATGKKISLGDPELGKEKLTIHLDGESFDNSMQTICASLNLEYTEINGVYVLTSRSGAR